MEEGLTKKVELIRGGGIRLPEGYTLPCRVSHSTAGPGAGMGSAVFAFEGYRVKKSVSYDTGEFDLIVGPDGSLSLLRDGETFLDGVTIQPVVRHCPNQAFFNLSQRCIYGCAYCTSPLLDPSTDKGLTTDTILGMLDESVKESRIKTVAFTSGIVGSVDQTVDRLAEAIAAVRERYPKFTIGVEPYITEGDQIRRLREAGANEIKINVECATGEIFGRVCPDLDYDNTFAMLREANNYFKKGKIATNVLYGLGETDQDIDMVLERLCRMNVLPGLRMVRINDMNRERLAAAGVPVDDPPSTLRMVFLAGLQKSAMKRHGLNPERFHSMCFSCSCCDIVPFVDFRSVRGRGDSPHGCCDPDRTRGMPTIGGGER